MAFLPKPIIVTALSGGEEFCEKNPNFATFLRKDRFLKRVLCDNPLQIEANTEYPANYVEAAQETTYTTGKMVFIDFSIPAIDFLMEKGLELAVMIPSHSFIEDYPDAYDAALRSLGYTDDLSLIKSEVERIAESELVTLTVLGYGYFDSIGGTVSQWPQVFFKEVSPRALVSADKRMKMMLRLSESWALSDQDYNECVDRASYMVDKIIDETYSTYVR